MSTGKLILLICSCSALAVALFVVSRNRHTDPVLTPPQAIRELVKQSDTTHALDASSWARVKGAMESNDTEMQVSGMEVAQSTKVPEQVQYTIQKAMELKNSSEWSVRSCSFITLWKLDAPNAMLMVKDALTNDKSKDVRELMQAIIMQEAGKKPN